MLSARSLPSLPTTTLSEIELNGGHHQLWSEGCWDPCQQHRLSNNPIALTSFFPKVLWDCNSNSESAKIVTYVA